VGARYYQLHDLANAKLWLQKSAAQGNQQAAGFLNMLNGTGLTPAPPARAPMPGNAGMPISGTAGMPAGTGLCPGTGRSLEKNGILGTLQQAIKQMPASGKPQLSMVMLMTQGVCQYTFVLASGQAMTFADVPGGLRSMGSRPATGATKVVLPPAFTDLPAAIMAAQNQGMQLPLKSAMLSMAQPSGKSPLAVWTLQPQRDPSGRVESYFVAAADGGRPLTLNDVSNVAGNYNAQWQKIIDQFHAAAAAAQQNKAAAAARSCVNYPTVAGVGLPFSGHWAWTGPVDIYGRHTTNLGIFWKCMPNY
jgi:hypothetical protein